MKEEKLVNLVNRPSLFIYSLCFSTTILLGFYLYFLSASSNYSLDFIITSKHGNYHDQIRNSSLDQPAAKDDENCDLFKGRWIRDARGPLYSNFSCKTLPYQKNCFLHGRKDMGFLHWRWKPEQCQLPVFDPRSFLSIVRGKTMGFIGDSVARNHMESLLCLLSAEETPKQAYSDAEERTTIWQFPRHNFTLIVLWSPFLVSASEIVVNGTATGGFHLHLDKIDESWEQKLPTIDYAIISDSRWFFRPIYLHEGGRFLGCIYCQEQNVTHFDPGFGIQRAFRFAFKYINGCNNCSRTVTLLRTSSPSQFENGDWNTGGTCIRTSPLAPEEINVVDGNGVNWDNRNIQFEEFDSARRLGEEKGNIFDILDVTGAMLMRPDGHPGLHWMPWRKGYSDCIHWCLPGPIDTWNEFLLEVLRRQSHFSAIHQKKN